MKNLMASMETRVKSIISIFMLLAPLASHSIESPMEKKSIEELLCEGDAELADGSYEQAANLYSELEARLEDLQSSKNYRSKNENTSQSILEAIELVKLREACAYYFSGDIEFAKKYLSNSLLSRNIASLKNPSLQNAKLLNQLLLIMCMKKEGRFRDSLSFYLDNIHKKASENPLRSHAALIAAYSALQIGELDMARKILAKTQASSNEAKILLACAEIKSKNFEKSLALVRSCKKRCDDNLLLAYCDYLEGLALAASDPENAIKNLEASLENAGEYESSAIDSPWIDHAERLLGWCLINASIHESPRSIEIDMESLERAVDIFQKIWAKDQSLNSLLGITWALFIKEKYQDNFFREITPISEDMLVEHLKIRADQIPPEVMHLISFLKILQIADPKACEDQWKEFLASRSLSQAGFIQSSILCAQNSLLIPQDKFRKESDINHTALEMIDQSLFLSPIEQKKRISQLIIRSLLQINKKEALLHACKILDGIPYRSSSSNSYESQEFLLLSASLHALLDPADQRSIDACQKFIKNNPQSSNRPIALHLAGALLDRQKKSSDALELYETILSDYPSYIFRDDVLYRAANLSDKLAKTAEIACKYRKELYENYPNSRFAAESYFRLYPEADYRSSITPAINHLKEFPPYLESSPFGAAAGFYIGLYFYNEADNKKNPTEQANLLNDAIAYITFCQNFDLNDADHDAAAAWIEEAKLEGALISAKAHQKLAILGIDSVQNFAKCAKMFEELKSVIQERISTLKNSKDQELRNQLATRYQECCFNRFRSLEMLGKEHESREELQSLIEYAHREEGGKTLYFTKGSIAFAMIMSREGKDTDALELLSRAIGHQTSQSSREELLEIWIAESQILKKMNRLKESMGLLSKVINDDSASSLRVQAMYLRAENYEQQGRRDLALRQLEACSKKGGEWGLRSAKKLEEIYGYE